MLDHSHPGHPSFGMAGLNCVNSFLPAAYRAGACKCWLCLVYWELGRDPLRSVTQSGYFSTKSTLRWSPWILLWEYRNCLGASPSSFLLPFFVAHKFLSVFWTHLPRYELCALGLGHHGKASLCLKEEVTRGMCWTHCRGAGCALALSSHVKARGLIHLNEFLVCIFLYWNSGVCCTEEVAAMVPSRSLDFLLFHGLELNQS